MTPCNHQPGRCVVVPGIGKLSTDGTRVNTCLIYAAVRKLVMYTSIHCLSTHAQTHTNTCIYPSTRPPNHPPTHPPTHAHARTHPPTHPPTHAHPCIFVNGTISLVTTAVMRLHSYTAFVSYASKTTQAQFTVQYHTLYKPIPFYYTLQFV